MADIKKVYAQIEFDLKPRQTERQVIEIHTLAYKYVYHLYKGSKVLKDPKALKALGYILHYSQEDNYRDRLIEISIKYEFPKLLVNIIGNVYQRLIECYSQDTDNDQESSDQVDSLAICLMSLTILENFSSKSVKFCHQIQSERGVQTLFAILNNRIIQSGFFTLLEQRMVHSMEFILLRSIFKRVFISLCFLSRCSQVHKREWLEANAVKNLLFYLTKVNEEMDSQIAIVMTIAQIADDIDLELFPEMVTSSNLIKYLIRLVAQAASIINSNSKSSDSIKRVNLAEGSQYTAYVVKFNGSNEYWSLIQLLNSINNLAVIEKLKSPIYFDHNLRHFLKSILFSKYVNSIERHHCLLVLFQLCYEPSVAADVRANYEINSIKNAASSMLLGGIKGLLESDDRIEACDTYKYHVAMCYDPEDQEACEQIKSALEASTNYIVCMVGLIEVNLNSRLNMLRSSLCVLTCLSEKYRQDPVNRYELEYIVDSLNKPIFGLILQQEFTISGWLKKFLKSNQYINWTNYSFADGMSQLKSQIRPVLQEEIGRHTFLEDSNEQAEPSRDNLDRRYTIIPALRWTEREVLLWLERKNIHRAIIDYLMPCDGQLLYKCYELKSNANFYFYQALKKQSLDESRESNGTSTASSSILELADFAYFSSELRRLFD